MRSLRIVFAVVVVALAAAAGWYFLHPRAPGGENLTVYYTKLDGTTLGSWQVSTRTAQPGEESAARLHDLATYAAVQAVAGPPPDIQAVRFPSGTRVLDVAVNGPTAVVDLHMGPSDGGSFQETGEFKGLVYTLTGIPSINAVQITIEGRTVETLPGGHLELDEPLRRSDW